MLDDFWPAEDRFFGIGGILILAVTVIACILIPRFARRRIWPWVAVVGFAVAGFATLGVVSNSMAVSRGLDQLEDEVGLPVTYAAAGSSITLRADGTAAVDDVRLGDGVTRIERGRWCLTGESFLTTGDGTWSMADADSIRIESDGNVAMLRRDPKEILGYGWRKGLVSTSCDRETSAEFYPRR